MEIIRDEESFLALEPHWDGLVARNAVRTPFLRWDWVSLWWEQYRDRFQLAVGVIRDACGEPLAIAPLVIGRMSWARCGVRQLSWLGGIGEIKTEGMDLIIPKGQEAWLAPVLCGVFSKLSQDWDAVMLGEVHDESPNRDVLLRTLAACGLGKGVSRTVPCHIVSLPDNWSDYEARRKSNWRRHQRGMWKRLKEDHAMKLMLAGRDVTMDEGVKALMELHAQRFGSSSSASFMSAASQSFHHRLIQRWLPQGRAFIPLIEAGGRLAAANYIFAEDGRAWAYQGGWNADYAGAAIGTAVESWSMQCAIGMGLSAYDFLPGDSDYKQRWADTQRKVLHMECFDPLSARAGLFRLLRHVKQRCAGVRASGHEVLPSTES